jgi:hypothetical protein
MAASAMTIGWSEESPTDEDAEEGTIRLRRDMHAIYNSCMPGAPRRAGAVYWWSEEIARFREACIPSWCQYTRSRRRRQVDGATVAHLYLSRSAEAPAVNRQGGEEAGLGQASGQPRFRSLRAPLRDSV